ncbi:MFS transporter [Actinotalea sp. BY-33]|uniref:MFS transporter n=1 Tax=Actinotalea soli TaxID=2819234 RepID=A0A939LSE7_9CELL|nr:MFS transporter [Actinotalea soli]MBO1752195.1 MFS transporter [Actinotalea soli]
MSPTFASLRFFNYRLWFAGALVANIGTWMQRVAQDWLVLTVLTDDSGVAVGITTALQFAPFLVLSAWAGVLADRVDRRKLLIATQTAQGVLAAGLGALVLSGRAELWHVYVFAALLGCVSAIDGPARQTFVADIVPAEKLSNAVGLNSASFNAARLIGPGLAGLLIAVVGTGWVFVINAATFAATILALTQMRLRELQPREPTGRGKGQIRAGIAYVRHRSDIVVIMVVIGVVSTFGLNFQLTSAVMARTEFGRGPQEYGILGSVLAIGSLAGALLAARRERPRVRLVIGAAFAFGVTTGVMALMPTYPSYVVACIPVGFASLTMMTAANSTIQMSTDPAMRGRVMSLYMVVFLGATPVGSPIVGWIAETYGARWAIGIGSISALLVSVGAALWAARRWNVSVRYRFRSRPHLQVRYLDHEHDEELARADAARALSAQQATDRASSA